MQNPRYALVAYVRNAVGEFVENLRQELHPDLPHLPAHVTILPPRCLPGGELAALETLEEVCSQAEPFEVTLGDVETFVPVTPTVFIRVAHAAYRLHDGLNKVGANSRLFARYKKSTDPSVVQFMPAAEPTGRLA